MTSARELQGDETRAGGSRVRMAVEASTYLAAALVLVWAFRADRAWFETHMMPFYCAVDRTDLRKASMVRAGAALFGLALAVAARFVGRSAARRAPRELALSILRWTIAAVLALLASDLLLHWKRIDPRPQWPPNVIYPKGEPDAEQLWHYLPARTTRTTIAGREVAYAINPQGYRTRDENDVIDPGRPTILFSGESIAFGATLPWDETYPARVASDLGAQAVNLAVAGYGVDQAYVRTREALRDFPRPLAVVTLLVREQVPRTIVPGRRRLRLTKEGELIPFDDMPPTFWRDSPLRSVLANVLPHDDEALRISRAVVRATSDVARRHDAIALFVLTNYASPCMTDASGQSSLERALFDEGAPAHVRVDLDPSWHGPADLHPDARGHAELAAEIERGLRAAGLGR
jgi:hypothetical protein